MLMIVILLVACFGISLAANWLLCVYGDRLRLLSLVTERSSHRRPIPLGGGLGMALAVIIAALFLQGNLLGIGKQAQIFPFLLIFTATLLICLIGLIDDFINLAQSIRLIAQIILVVFLLWSLQPLQPLNVYAGVQIAGAGLTILVFIAAVWWLNLFNFVDGLDGLAASQAIFILIGCLLVVLLKHPPAINSALALWVMCVIASSCGFLVLNWSPARIFMGDSGSLFLGMAILISSLVMINQNWLNYHSWLILCAVVNCDTTWTVINRLLCGHNPLLPHRSFGFHLLLQRVRRHQTVTMIYGLITLLWLIPLALVAAQLPKYSLVVTVIAYLPILIGLITVGAGRKTIDN